VTVRGAAAAVTAIRNRCIVRTTASVNPDATAVAEVGGTIQQGAAVFVAERQRKIAGLSAYGGFRPGGCAPSGRGSTSSCSPPRRIRPQVLPRQAGDHARRNRASPLSRAVRRAGQRAGVCAPTGYAEVAVLPDAGWQVW
jgi:hypothetical protein